MALEFTLRVNHIRVALIIEVTRNVWNRKRENCGREAFIANVFFFGNVRQYSSDHDSEIPLLYGQLICHWNFHFVS